MMRNLSILLTLWIAFSSSSAVSSAFVVPTTKYCPFRTKSSRDHIAPVTTTTTTTTAFNYHAAAFLPRSSSSCLYMGWGPEPIWSNAQVLSNKPACSSEASVSVMIQVSPETCDQYTMPGQYVQLRLDDDDTKPLFLAIANAPPSTTEEENKENNTNVFEFLIKKKAGTNEWATSLTAGQTVQISQVLGNGFLIKENFNGFKYDFPTQNILLFATGSGIAPLKAVMESNLLELNQGRTARLYYGERCYQDICFLDKFKEWEQAGIEVVVVLSQEDWEGRCGYVQNALEEDGVPIPRNSGALLCGQKGMAESITEILKTAGVFEGRILTNF